MTAKPKAGTAGQAAALPKAQQTAMPVVQSHRERTAVLIERLPVLLSCLLSELRIDEGDNPATVVLTGIALEHASELQDLTDSPAP